MFSLAAKARVREIAGRDDGDRCKAIVELAFASGDLLATQIAAFAEEPDDNQGSI
jgi:hypothetical protein